MYARSLRRILIPTFLGVACAAAAVSRAALSTENQVLHFDAGQHVYVDEGVTPATHGDTVRQWGDISAFGGGAWLGQENENFRPTLVTDQLGGHPVLRLTRESRAQGGWLKMEREGLGEPLLQELDTNQWTWTMVLRANDPTVDQQFPASLSYEEGTHVFGEVHLVIAGNGHIQAGIRDLPAGATGHTSTLGRVPESKWKVVSLTWDGEAGTLSLSVNGETRPPSETAFISLPLTFEALWLGNRAAENRPFHGDIAEFVVYNTALSEEQRRANEAALAAKYAIEPERPMPFAAHFGQVGLVETLDGVSGATFDVAEARVGASPFTDANAVEGWANQSALGSDIVIQQADASQRPALLPEAVNGRPAIRFDRVSNSDGRWLEIFREDVDPQAAQLLDTNTITWTMVVRVTDPGAGQQFITSLGYQEGTATFGDVYTLIAGNGQLQSGMRNDADGNITNNLGRIPEPKWKVVSLVWDGAAGTIVQYVDGEAAQAVTQNAFRSLPLTWESLRLANRRDNARPFDGELAEFVIYNEPLGESDRLANEQWLAEKYGVEISGGAGSAEGLKTENQVFHFDAGAGVETVDAVQIVSLPAELDGKVAIRTSNAEASWGDDEILLPFEVGRSVTVYIANDPSTEPEWLERLGFSKTAMAIETTASDFDVWERSYNARDIVMFPGKSAQAGENNYWVILSEGPDAMADSTGGILFSPIPDWNNGRHSMDLTTDPEGAFHTASLVTSVSNFQPESGFRLGANFRVPQLQHEGENAYGLLVLGDLILKDGVFIEGAYDLDTARGIRAEWLPRQADGSSVLRLVNNATGQILDAVAWTGEAPVRTDDWVTGDDQLELFWDPRSSELPSTYFTNDESKEILRMPDGLDPDFLMEGIKTANDLSNTSDTFLQFNVQSGDTADGNEGVTVFVAWDIRNSGFEPPWLLENFEKTDHLVEVSSDARYHRLWAMEVEEGAQVTLPGASAGGGGPYPEGTDNYFILVGDVRTGLETVYRLETEGIRENGEWTLSATLTDGAGHSQTVSANLAESLSGQNVFGVSVRHPDRTDSGQTPVTPIWQTFDLTMDFLSPPVAAGFAAWQQEHFTPEQLADPAISGPDAAPAGDGVKNLVKYALDLLPFVPVTSADLPQMDIDEEGRLILVYWERTDIDDIEYIPEVSENLILWQSGPGHIVELFRNSASGNLEEVGVRGNVSDEAGKGFVRLLIEKK